MTIRDHYNELLSVPNDIHEHLPALRRLASQCRHVTELGVRFIVSTWALLDAAPETLVSVDIVHPNSQGGDLEEVRNQAAAAGINFTFIQADDTLLLPWQTDMLFIDTLHDREQIQRELDHYAPLTSRYIVMHDTQTFGNRGETPGHDGLLAGLDRFLTGTEEGLNWSIVEQYNNNNGLTVLERLRPRVKLITWVYNEAQLLPFFLRHYWWADIHAVFTESPDASLLLLKNAPNVVEIERFDFENGINDQIRTSKMNDILARGSAYDWHALCDVDELLWPMGDPSCNRARWMLGRIAGDKNVVMGKMWNVFRHVSDSDLNASLPAWLQRRHGVMDRSSGDAAHYQKPIIIRANRRPTMDLGNHRIVDLRPGEVADEYFDGAHWQNADPSFCVDRRVRDRSRRLSQVNLQNGWGGQHFNLTDERVRDYCKTHENDPQVF